MITREQRVELSRRAMIATYDAWVAQKRREITREHDMASDPEDHRREVALTAAAQEEMILARRYYLKELNLKELNLKVKELNLKELK